MGRVLVGARKVHCVNGWVWRVVVRYEGRVVKGRVNKRYGEAATVVAGVAKMGRGFEGGKGWIETYYGMRDEEEARSVVVKVMGVVKGVEEMKEVNGG